MNAYQVYKTYLALRAHFITDEYDIFKMQGRVRANKQSFMKRKDLFSIERLSQTYKDDEVVNFLVSNFIEGDRWGGVFDNEAHDRYLKWMGRIESLTYNFTNDLDSLCKQSSNWSDMVTSTRSSHPYIIKAFLGSVINIETLTILDSLTDHSIRNIDSADTIIWPGIRKIVVKYAPFLNYDHERYQKLFGSRFEYRRTENTSSGTACNGVAGATDSNAGKHDQHDDVYQRDAKIPTKNRTKPARIKQTSRSVALSEYFE